MNILLAALLCALCGPGDDYDALLADAAAKDLQREEAMRSAHTALDDGDDERAVALARRARMLAAEIAGDRERARVCLAVLVPQLAVTLDDDEFDVREQASARLRKLGEAALPGLLRIRRAPLTPETRYRIDELLGGITVDGEGRVHQWAVAAMASSEYTPNDWAAKQAVGPPDSSEGDARTAWAAKDADGGIEWLQLRYALSLRISRIRIRENLTRGGVVAVDVVGPDGTRRRAWEGTDAGDAWLELDLKGVEGREVIVVLDTRKHAGWEEIDAVELIGDPAPEK
ncbi:MAG TPA: hypothetical protein VE981_15270 [Planctomycetota bacterium]|nr:hypothetical protein [Planctomycetota bacterium]